jgi:RNA polymerase-binding transcription factor DksA
MNQQLIKKLKHKLEEEKKAIQKELQSFAEEDKKLKGDWDTRFPRFDKETGGSSLEKAADEVEQYEALLPIEFSLEKKLQNINSALERIKKGQYGICKKCKKTISPERLEAFPAAETCKKCNN